MAVKPLQSPLTNLIHGKEARGKAQLLTKSVQGLSKGEKNKDSGLSQRSGTEECGQQERRRSIPLKRGGRRIRENEVRALPWFIRRNLMLV